MIFGSPDPEELERLGFIRCFPYDLTLTPLAQDLEDSKIMNAEYPLPFVGVTVLPFLVESRSVNTLEQCKRELKYPILSSMMSPLKYTPTPIKWNETVSLFNHAFSNLAHWNIKNIRRADNGTTDEALWTASLCDFVNNIPKVLKSNEISLIVCHGNVIRNLLEIATIIKGEFSPMIEVPAVPNGGMVKMLVETSTSKKYEIYLMRHCTSNDNISRHVNPRKNQTLKHQDLTTCADAIFLNAGRRFLKELLETSHKKMAIYSSAALRAIETALAVQGPNLISPENLKVLSRLVQEPIFDEGTIYDFLKRSKTSTMKGWNVYAGQVGDLKIVAKENLNLHGSRETQERPTPHTYTPILHSGVSSKSESPENLKTFDRIKDKLAAWCQRHGSQKNCPSDRCHWVPGAAFRKRHILRKFLGQLDGRCEMGSWKEYAQESPKTK